MKSTRNSFLQFLSLILSTWYQSLGLRIEEFIGEILISVDKAVVVRGVGGVCFLKNASQGQMGPHC